MNRLSEIALLLVFGILVVSCYEPVSITSGKDWIPWVHCVLNPTDTQYLELHYMVNGRSDRIPADAISVTMEEWRTIADGNSQGLYKTHEFKKVGEGIWRLVLTQSYVVTDRFADRIAPGATCHLKICLSGGDSLFATTTMPHSVDVKQCFGLSPDKKMFEFDLNGKHYSYSPAQPTNNPSLYVMEDRCHFSLPECLQAIWVYKLGWSKENMDWFVEDKLSTNREDRADRFNLTGEIFSGGGDSPSGKAYPEVVGQPFHYRYLRFGGGPKEDTLAIAGYFSGPHFGVLGTVLSVAKGDQLFEKTVAMAQGKEYEENLLTTNLAGKVVFKIVSDEYDCYLKDVAEYELIRNIGTDIVGIYANTNTYTNISGGTGIFGAEITNHFYWTCGEWQF